MDGPRRANAPFWFALVSFDGGYPRADATTRQTPAAAAVDDDDDEGGAVFEPSRALVAAPPELGSLMVAASSASASAAVETAAVASLEAASASPVKPVEEDSEFELELVPLPDEEERAATARAAWSIEDSSVRGQRFEESTRGCFERVVETASGEDSRECSMMTRTVLHRWNSRSSKSGWKRPSDRENETGIASLVKQVATPSVAKAGGVRGREPL